MKICKRSGSSLTPNPSESTETDQPVDEQSSNLDAYARSVSEAVGALRYSTDHATVKVRVAPNAWSDTLHTAKSELGLVYFSYLSAIDWSNEVEVGDAPAEPVEERYELLCGVGDLTDGRVVHFSTDLSKDAASIASLVPIYAGANWHEREANEMFDISFEGHPNPAKLYLPTEFEGHPLQKSYPLLSREVKPWPGTVDVEGMPEVDEAETTPAGASTENPGQ